MAPFLSVCAHEIDAFLQLYLIRFFCASTAKRVASATSMPRLVSITATLLYPCSNDCSQQSTAAASCLLMVRLRSCSWRVKGLSFARPSRLNHVAARFTRAATLCGDRVYLVVHETSIATRIHRIAIGTRTALEALSSLCWP